MGSQSQHSAQLWQGKQNAVSIAGIDYPASSLEKVMGSCLMPCLKGSVGVKMLFTEVVGVAAVWTGVATGGDVTGGDALSAEVV